MLFLFFLNFLIFFLINFINAGQNSLKNLQVIKLVKQLNESASIFLILFSYIIIKAGQYKICIAKLTGTTTKQKYPNADIGINDENPLLRKANAVVEEVAIIECEERLKV